ncbi:MAG TPA: class I SAM-dependent methyltransferase [Pyrinomonadaceae bacterium]|nr:class I SAM-dependent methyltransferase [Pyrinomonadaceae bacterium]
MRKQVWAKHRVWEKPLYPFRVPSGLDDDDRRLLTEIYIDVTGSAPSFDTPESTLSKVFEEVLKEFPKTRKIKVLDFGAGKLRNSIYFLDRGHIVYAVEYEGLKNSSRHAKKLFAQADEHSKNFKEYIFPQEFLKSKEEFDLIILVNVLTVMPVPAERWLVLMQCHQRLKPSGYVLWYSQFGDTDQRARCTDNNRVSDGWYIGKNKKFKTFYREYYEPEMKDMFLSCGFDFYKSIKAPGNQAKLFKKRKNVPLSRILNARLIEAAEIIDTTMADPLETTPKRVIQGEPTLLHVDGNYKECVPNPPSLSFEQLLQQCLTRIATGNAGSNANDYETVIALLVSRIFNGDLRNLKPQEEINEGRRRVDFVLTNGATEGFFWHLSERHKLKCPYILFECKNYKEDLKNGEFAQLADRLQHKIGQVGIIVCRSIENKKKCLKDQQDRFPDKLILVLDDDDIMNLISFHVDGDREGLLNYLDDKAKAVIFSK